MSSYNISGGIYQGDIPGVPPLYKTMHACVISIFHLNSSSICKRRLFEKFRDVVSCIPKETIPDTLR